MQYLTNMEDYDAIAEAMVAVNAADAKTEAAAAAAGRGEPPVVWWEFKTGPGWTRFSRPVCDGIQAALVAGVHNFEVKQDGVLFEIDLLRMTRKDKISGDVRAIRAPNGTVVPAAVQPKPQPQRHVKPGVGRGKKRKY